MLCTRPLIPWSNQPRGRQNQTGSLLLFSDTKWYPRQKMQHETVTSTALAIYPSEMIHSEAVRLVWELVQQLHWSGRAQSTVGVKLQTCPLPPSTYERALRPGVCNSVWPVITDCSTLINMSNSEHCTGWGFTNLEGFRHTALTRFIGQPSAATASAASCSYKLPFLYSILTPNKQ